jgi:hypothetical protein
MLCSKCGTEGIPGKKFCAECGSSATSSITGTHQVDGLCICASEFNPRGASSHGAVNVEPACGRKENNFVVRHQGCRGKGAVAEYRPYRPLDKPSASPALTCSAIKPCLPDNHVVGLGCGILVKLARSAPRRPMSGMRWGERSAPCVGASVRHVLGFAEYRR